MSKPSIFGKEPLYGETIDNCVVDAGIKTGSGFLLGGLFSMLFSKGKRWPVTLGAGIGLGLSLSACQNSLRNLSATSYSKTAQPTLEPETEIEELVTDVLSTVETLEKIPQNSVDVKVLKAVEPITAGEPVALVEPVTAVVEPVALVEPVTAVEPVALVEPISAVVEPVSFDDSVTTSTPGEQLVETSIIEPVVIKEEILD